MIIYIIAIVLLIAAGILTGKARPFSESIFAKWPGDWRGFAGQLIATYAIIMVQPRLRADFSISPFREQPFGNGLFYLGLLIVCVLFEGTVIAIVNPAKYRPLLDRWKR
ncbi:MAG TPA: hypothetical protein VG537_09720 [Candidatus Kapabacteria bacterium]|jgi:hypothetical protein|nr:hypothetical protein [Candidatus Kapabacteria bacterium]